MDRSLLLPILVVFVSTAAIVGTAIFLLWAAQYFGRRAYRRATRQHLYKPIRARVIRVGYNGKYGATLYVEYEHSGATIVHRVMTTHEVAQQAERSKQVSLRVDPDYPKDAVVDPTFKA